MFSEDELEVDFSLFEKLGKVFAITAISARKFRDSRNFRAFFGNMAGLSLKFCFVVKPRIFAKIGPALPPSFLAQACSLLALSLCQLDIFTGRGPCLSSSSFSSLVYVWSRTTLASAT